MTRFCSILIFVFWAVSAQAQSLSVGADAGPQLWLRNRPNTQSQQAVLSPGVRAFLRWQVKRDWSLELGLSAHGRHDNRDYSVYGDFFPYTSQVHETYQERLYAASLALQYEFAGKAQQKCHQLIGLNAGLSVFDPGLRWQAFSQGTGGRIENSQGQGSMGKLRLMTGFQYQFQYQFFPCWMARFTAAAGGDPYRILGCDKLPVTSGYMAPISFFSFSAGVGRLLP